MPSSTNAYLTARTRNMISSCMFRRLSYVGLCGAQAQAQAEAEDEDFNPEKPESGAPEAGSEEV